MRRIVSKGLVVVWLGGLIASTGGVGCVEPDPASSGSTAGVEDAASTASVATPKAEAAVEPPSGAARGGRAVYVNGRAVPDTQLAELERRHGLAIVDGRYWYDAASGAAGPEGGPTLAFVAPGLVLGGPLAADASRGRTGVFVNGRELPERDLVGLTALVGAIEPGRYFIDALGNAGLEGQPPTLNLLALAQAARAGGGGDGWYSQGAQAGGNASGGSGYVMGRDASGNVWGASY
ncbi:MAG: hypothetical protein R3F35_19985 [Myxococcota bacterium]